MLSSPINQLRQVKRNFNYFLDDTKRFIKYQLSTPELINQKEIRVVGLRRSGNHGIITWIRRHYVKRIWHLNNVTAVNNPYRKLAENYPNKEKLQREAQGIFSKKECLIYNFENHTLDSIVNAECEKKHDIYFGKSAFRYDLLILRDPYNMFASICKAQGQDSQNRNYSKTYPKNQKLISELWLDYAKEFLGETNYLSYKKILVNYNQWVSDQKYRQEIAKGLGLEFCDAGFNVVKDYGGGSSFDGTKFNEQANQMKTLNRWQEFIDNPQYQQMFNQEIIDYAQRIFGSIEGTEMLLE